MVSINLQRFLQQDFAFRTPRLLAASLWSSSIYIKVHYIGHFVHYLIVITLRTIYV